MSYFLLPQLNYKITINNLELVIGRSTNVISKSLFNYLNDMKTQIDNYSGLFAIQSSSKSNRKNQFQSCRKKKIDQRNR